MDLEQYREVENFQDKLNSVFKEIWGQEPFEIRPYDDSSYQLQTRSKFCLTKFDAPAKLFGTFRYKFDFEAQDGKFSVQKSSFLFFDSDRSVEPLFEYNFNRRRKRDTVPRSYLRVHISEDTRFALLMNSREEGTESMEFPLGGEILRPCLEDTILGCANSFNIGLTDDDRVTLLREVREFRSNQKESIIGERKAEAVNKLEDSLKNLEQRK